MANNRIEIDEANNRAILWLERIGTMGYEKNKNGIYVHSGKIQIPSYIDLDDKIIDIVKSFPKDWYATYEVGFLPYVRSGGVALQNWIWSHIHGDLPTDKNVLDHVSGARNDNRLINLNPATNSENTAKARKGHRPYSSDAPPNDPNGLTTEDFDPVADPTKDENDNKIGYENHKHTQVFVNSIFFGRYAPEDHLSSNWQYNIGKMLLNEQASRQTIHERLNIFNNPELTPTVEREIEAVLNILKWNPPFL